MDATDDHRVTRLGESLPDGEGARELARLHGHQQNRGVVKPFEPAIEFFRPHKLDDLVDQPGIDRDVGTQRLTVGGIVEQTGDHRQSVGDNVGSPPLDDISIIVVLGRLDQQQTEPLSGIRHRSLGSDLHGWHPAPLGSTRLNPGGSVDTGSVESSKSDHPKSQQRHSATKIRGCPSPC